MALGSVGLSRQCCPRPRQPWQPSATVKAARKMASTRGWVPLRGSTKQKRWAAEIRAGLIPRLPAELQEVAGNLADSGFWIDHRNEQPEKFHDLIRRCSH